MSRRLVQPLPGRRLPLTALVHEAARSGPVVALTAGVHGDEWVGPSALLRLDQLLAGVLRAGVVVLYPVLNLSGLKVGSREVEEDGADLNRAFPGSPASPSGRLAEGLFDDLARRRPDLLVDLHSDAVWSVPYVLVDRVVHASGEPRLELEARMDALAAATGLVSLREYPEQDYRRHRLDRSLSGAVVNRLGIPSLTIEVGPRRGHHPPSIELAVHVVLRLLGALGMAEVAEGERPVGPMPLQVWRRGVAGRVRRAGILEPLVAPGTAFAAGELLARVRALDGSVEDEVRAEAPGLLVSWLDRLWVEAGNLVCTVGVAED